ncbi:NADH-ubiquinone oxidoreductase complex 1/LYR family protein, partial [Leucosporidium creatinivorum]
LQQLRYRARGLYKELQYLAREYPDPNYPIKQKLHNCFLAHVGKDREGVEQGIKKAEFIKSELEALYFLRKYRAMKGRY